MHRLFKNVAEFFMSVPTKSEFQDKGILTPEEFVRAGDLLTHKCPTWTWEAGDPSKAKDYLPKDKQYLVTRQVPCLQRAQNLGSGDREEVLHLGTGGDDDEWVSATSGATKSDDEIGEIVSGTANARIGDAPASSSGAAASAAVGGGDDDEIPDMDEFEEADNVLEDEATLAPAEDNIVKSRKYDISITYDLFYKTPRVWLFGYDENGKPLDPQRILEDIYSDYANRTVTIEQHPHLRLDHASIHPCRHANVMKKMLERLADEGKYMQVELYLFLFLKFISAVIPTINYDFTLTVDGAEGSGSSSGAGASARR